MFLPAPIQACVDPFIKELPENPRCLIVSLKQVEERITTKS
jgi:hypothetical protein